MDEAGAPERALDRIERVARAAFGSLTERPERDAIVVKTTGAPHPVIITIGGTVGSEQASIATLAIAVVLRFSWPEGVSDFLLREHTRIPFGRFVRTDRDDLWLTYELVATECTADQLATAVKVLADAAARTFLLLSRAGALDDR